MSQRDAKHLRCGSCGERALHFIVLDGFDVPACLRHVNVWQTPDFTVTARDDLARVIQRHSPASRALSLQMADAIIREWVPAANDYPLTLLRAVVGYDAANQSDLPLGLLDSLRAEVARYDTE